MNKIVKFKKYDDCIKVVLQSEDKFVFQVYDIANIDDEAWLIIDNVYDNEVDALKEFELDPPVTGWVIQDKFM